MAANGGMDDLRARLDSLGERIEAERVRSVASSGAPFQSSGWPDIVESHARLAQRIAEQREPDAHAIERIRADVEALALSLESWLRSIDGSYARQQHG
ncbi:MAG: hypothetical protein AB7O57_17115 [Hyphomicrobiaceae bacterium]